MHLSSLVLHLVVPRSLNMPTYEYKCTKCNNHFELFQKITDSPVEVCPVCKGKVKKLISGGAGLIFKGSGFYITDYKKKPETVDTQKIQQPVESTLRREDPTREGTEPKEIKTKPAKETPKANK